MSNPGPIWLELIERRVHLESGDIDGSRGRTRRLTTRELQVLRFVAARPSQDIDRDTILCEVFGYARGVPSRAVDKAVDSLRGKIEVDKSHPRHLLTVRGIGYRFVPLSAWAGSDDALSRGAALVGG